MRVLLDVRPTYQWLLAVASALLLVTGCGDKGLDKPLPAAKQTVHVSLPWRDGGRIPREYTCDGTGKVPTVRIDKAAPHGTAIVMSDPDAPGGTFVHWTRWGSVEGENSFGRTGYDGPCPPKGDKPHRYVVTVYVLKQKLGLPRGSKPDEVVAAIKKSAAESGSSSGFYGR
jgi:phosphatidylethanolamine-binding protein (PEBP) family uncharacterized protein